MTPERYRRMCRVLEARQPDLTVLMERVHKPHNFSAILRTCDAVGLLEAHAVIPGAWTGASPAVSGGTGKWVKVEVHRTLGEAWSVLEEKGFKLVAAHPAEEALDFRDYDFCQPTAVVLGTEKFGLSPEAASRCCQAISIPMWGMGRSLNVSVAAALILYEAERQRVAGGLYRQRRLPDGLYRRTLFEWGYPELAQRCRLRGKPYPELDTEGQLRRTSSSGADLGEEEHATGGKEEVRPPGGQCR